MANILGYLFILIIGILIGNVAQISLIKGIGLFLVGAILAIYTLYLYKKKDLFTLPDNQMKLILLVCLEVIGFVVGFIGLITPDVFTMDIVIIIFLICFICFIFIKELIKILSKANQRKNMKTKLKN